MRKYRLVYRPAARKELESFRREQILNSAVERAARARDPEGRRHAHQRRLSWATLEAVYRRLSRLDFGRCRSFDELHDVIEAALAPVHGVGELMVYDTALRIGARLGVSPTRVYLHRGTRKGAQVLGLDWRARYLEMRDLPRELRELEPHEVEDCLCIFKRELRLAVPSGRRRRTGGPSPSA